MDKCLQVSSADSVHGRSLGPEFWRLGTGFQLQWKLPKIGLGKTASNQQVSRAASSRTISSFVVTLCWNFSRLGQTLLKPTNPTSGLAAAAGRIFKAEFSQPDSLVPIL
jgi:hypothetical protein